MGRKKQLDLFATSLFFLRLFVLMLRSTFASRAIGCFLRDFCRGQHGPENVPVISTCREKFAMLFRVCDTMNYVVPETPLD